MTVAIGSYARLTTHDGLGTGFAFQNFFQGETRTYNSNDYTFGAFGFSGGTVDIEAANVQASLVFALNQLALNVFQQAVNERWLVEVRTVWLDPDTLDESDSYGEEVYAITGLEHDSSRLSVRLGSPLDAVSQNAPRRLLTSDLVGSLPSTGNINLQ